MGNTGLPSLKAYEVQSWVSPQVNKHGGQRRRQGEQKYRTDHEKLILTTDTLK